MNEKIICEERTDEGIRLFKDGCCGTIRTIEAGGDKRVIEINRLGNIYGEDKGTGYAGNVWDKDGLCPTLNTMQGGNREPMIVASRGRNPDNPSDRTPGNHVEQRLEPNSEGICNTLTSVQKDNLVLEPNKTYLENAIEQIIEKNNGEIPDAWDLYNKNPINNGISKALSAHCGNTGTAGATAVTQNYRIRKLTPKECAKLMKFSDEDANKMLEVNSNTQVFKQCGNSIVVSVLEAIFCQMNIKGCPTWEERAKEEYL